MLDIIDINILKNFNKLGKNKEISIWKMMRRIFPKGSHREEMLVKRRIEKMEKFGLFIIEKNSPKRYSMISDNVIFKKSSFFGRVNNSIHLKINGKGVILEL